MSNRASNTPPPDQPQRERALDPANSILVQAPAGSGKTDLLTRRFLRLLTEVEDPGQIVAITFTKAAAAEMRHRILSKLEAAAQSAAAPTTDDPFSMESLAHRAWQHSRALGWNLLDQPAQLRISTIDSFCRDLALQQPLLTGLGDGLGIYEQPDELYRRAARQSLEQLDRADSFLRDAIESLLLWRDNNWQEMENQLVEMLKSRDRWMHDFVLEREQDWEALRAYLERPFLRAIQKSLAQVGLLLDQVPGSRDEALGLARFACQQGASALFQPLAELPDFPEGNITEIEALEEARQAHLCLADLLLTKEGSFRKQVNKSIGFPTEGKSEKAQLLDLIARLSAIPGLEPAIAGMRGLPPTRYSEDDWPIVRACFTVLRNAAAQLKVVFAEVGAVDYIEVAQIALSVLRGPDGEPTDAAITVADKIHHILVDEFQDTSRRQHELLRRLIAAWPEREGRSCFVVGDPMQSIYFFRDADAELFPRVREAGLEIPHADPLLFDPVGLTSNFRTAKPLVEKLNEVFVRVFAANDGSGVTFFPADPAREELENAIQPAERKGAPSIRLLSGEWVGDQALNLAQPGPALPPEGADENSPEQAERGPGKTVILDSPSPVGASEVPRASEPNFELHIKFTPQIRSNTSASPDTPTPPQIHEIVALIQTHTNRMNHARSIGEKYRVAVLGRTRSALAPIAQALRNAAIPFRSVDLEKLSARPEVLDALAFARAILNPLDRVAWLGVLRATWCGLSLQDLHTLTSADDPELLSRPIPELLAERISLLSEHGRSAAARVLEALAAVPSLRFAQPTASLGTWLQQVWITLGGPQCVDRTARANLDLLWQSLDALPNGELDLLGPALDAALENLTAQPDPSVSSECGVQLMTIHKSKGLEFEVVIVPELQARSRKGESKLLSWLERGLPPEECSDLSGPSDEATEFLVAPLQFKGADPSTTKKWVDRVYRERESQETRRVLYVAATRARDELHLFAQPTRKQDRNGDWTLTEPKDSLLATAWPALHVEIQQRFDEWKAGNDAQADESSVIESLAASADGNLLVMPAPIRPTILRRLPADFGSAQQSINSAIRRKTPGLSNPEEMAGAPGPSPLGTGDRDTEEFSSSLFPRSLGPLSPALLYQRHEGGLLSRALGTAVHSLLEILSNLRKTGDWPAARAEVKQFEPRIVAQIRTIGIDPARSADLAKEALRIALDASNDPTGNWILSPHAEDSSEIRWTGIVAGNLRTVQVDRLFRAGLTPLTTGTEAWWIIDYKTAHADALDPAAALPGLRKLFAPQLETYARILSNLHSRETPIRAGLYYPRMKLFDWWET